MRPGTPVDQHGEGIVAAEQLDEPPHLDRQRHHAEEVPRGRVVRDRRGNGHDPPPAGLAGEDHRRPRGLDVLAGPRPPAPRADRWSRRRKESSARRSSCPPLSRSGDRTVEMPCAWRQNQLATSSFSFSPLDAGRIRGGIRASNSSCSRLRAGCSRNRHRSGSPTPPRSSAGRSDRPAVEPTRAAGPPRPPPGARASSRPPARPPRTAAPTRSSPARATYIAAKRLIFRARRVRACSRLPHGRLEASPGKPGDHRQQRRRQHRAADHHRSEAFCLARAEDHRQHRLHVGEPLVRISLEAPPDDLRQRPIDPRRCQCAIGGGALWIIRRYSASRSSRSPAVSSRSMACGVRCGGLPVSMQYRPRAQRVERPIGRRAPPSRSACRAPCESIPKAGAC